MENEDRIGFGHPSGYICGDGLDGVSPTPPVDDGDPTVAEHGPHADLLEGRKAMKYDGGKPRVDLIPPGVILELAKIYAMGAEKYSEHGWLEDARQ
jgi:hypothetical protein